MTAGFFLSIQFMCFFAQRDQFRVMIVDNKHSTEECVVSTGRGYPPALETCG